MNVTEVTTIAGCVAALGVIALIASGWRQPARVERRSPRGLWVTVRGALHLSDGHRQDSAEGAPAPSDVAPVDPSAVFPTPWWHRARSAVGGPVLAVWMGAVAATLIGFAVAFVVISLTSMLKR